MEQVRKSGIKPQHILWAVIGFGLIAWFTEQKNQAMEDLNQVEVRLERKKSEVAQMELEKREKILEIKGLQTDPYIIEKRLREATDKIRRDEISVEDARETR
jgi:cell division protein FtsB